MEIHSRNPRVQVEAINHRLNQMKARILIGIVVFAMIIAMKNYHNQRQDVVDLQNSLSNLYKEFDTSTFPNLPAMTKLWKKVQQMPEQLIKLEEIHKASDNIGQKIEILHNYELDKIGRPDLALWNSGGRIAGIGADTKLLYSCNFFMRLAGCPNKVNGPEKTIQATMHPGECFTFRGNKATVFIRLVCNAIVDAVTVEHLTAKMSPTGDVSSAPKEFSVSVNIFPFSLSATQGQ